MISRKPHLEIDSQIISTDDITKMTYDQIKQLAGFLENEKEILFVKKYCNNELGVVYLDNLLFKLK